MERRRDERRIKMFDILKIVVILYMILLVPLMLGILWQRYIVKRNFGIATFVQGWLCMMALFYCETVPMVLSKSSLTKLKNTWLVTVIIINVFFFVIFLCTRKEWKLEKEDSRKSGRNVVILFLMIICSIFFLKPQTQDDTVEVVMESYMTDNLYQYQPYTEEVYQELPKEKAYSPIEMYYAVLANMVNAHPAIVVKVLIPIGFLPIFVFTYVMWARRLFRKNKKLQRVFLFLVGIIFLLPVISTNMTMLSVWQNCWRGEVLLATTVLPLVCSYVYNMIGELLQQWNKRTCIEYALKLFIVSLTAQLTYAMGMLFSCIIILSGILIIVARRCQQKYAANINHN